MCPEDLIACDGRFLGTWMMLKWLKQEGTSSRNLLEDLRPPGLLLSWFSFIWRAGSCPLHTLYAECSLSCLREDGGFITGRKGARVCLACLYWTPYPLRYLDVVCVEGLGLMHTFLCKSWYATCQLQIQNHTNLCSQKKCHSNYFAHRLCRF